MGVLVYIDDLVVYAKDKADLERIVKQVQEALAKAGFTVNPSKCQFNQTRVKFLGHVIEQGRIYPDPEKLEAIRNFPVPKDAKELRSYLGLVGWIRKFRADLLISLAPFRSLLKEETFNWTEAHTAAMAEINTKIADNLALEVFKPGETLELWTDASPYGFGAILLQNKRPLYCASRTLTKAESNYPQIDLELGAIAWAFERMDAFVYGSNVQVYSDHKPLTAITRKQIGDLSMRQQRMMARLMRYDFEVSYASAKLMDGPDALSRAPLKLTCNDERHPRNPLAPDCNINDVFISELSFTDLSDPLIDRIQKSASRDEEYQLLLKAAEKGFPESSKSLIGELWSLRDHLYASNGLVFRNRELIVPSNYRLQMTRILHQGHQSPAYMLRRAHGNVFWPRMTTDFINFAERCEFCQLNKPAQQKQPMLSIQVPSAPGLEIGSDYFSIGGKEYVLFVDLFSAWTEHMPTPSRRPETLIKILQTYMSRNGIPRRLYSDQGSSYASKEFEDFCEEWGIELITCSGEYPKGNGTAESAVKRVKKWLKSSENAADLAKATLAWHQTPIAPGRPTPAQLHLGRNLRDEVTLQVSKTDVDWKQIQCWKMAQKECFAKTYDRTTRDLKPLKPGDRVFVQIHGKWRRAQILEYASRPRSYKLRMSDTGAKLERNRIHLREDRTGQVPNPDSHLYFFFSGQSSHQEQRPSAVEQFEDTGEEQRPLEPDVRSMPGTQENAPAPSENAEPSHQHPASNSAPRAAPSSSKQKKHVDREQLFLSKEKISKFGRVTQNVQKYQS